MFKATIPIARFESHDSESPDSRFRIADSVPLRSKHFGENIGAFFVTNFIARKKSFVQTSLCRGATLSGPVRDTPPYRAIPFRDSIAQGGIAPICLVFIGQPLSGTVQGSKFLRGLLKPLLGGAKFYTPPPPLLWRHFLGVGGVYLAV